MSTLQGAGRQIQVVPSYRFNTQTLGFAGSSVQSKPENVIMGEMPVIDINALKADDVNAIRNFGESIRNTGFALVRHHFPVNLQQTYQQISELFQSHLPELESYRKQGFYDPGLQENPISANTPSMGKLRLKAWEIKPAQENLPPSQFHPTLNASLQKIQNNYLEAGNLFSQTLFNFLQVHDPQLKRMIDRTVLHKKDRDTFRLIEYPAYPAEKIDKTELFDRHFPHADRNAILTMNLSGSTPGLEVRPTGSNEWIPVDLPLGVMVVQAGKLLECLTQNHPQGQIKASYHRVVATPKQMRHPRISMPFQYSLNSSVPWLNLTSKQSIQVNGLPIKDIDHYLKEINKNSWSYRFLEKVGLS